MWRHPHFPRHLLYTPPNLPPEVLFTGPTRPSSEHAYSFARAILGTSPQNERSRCISAPEDWPVLGRRVEFRFTRRDAWGRWPHAVSEVAADAVLVPCETAASAPRKEIFVSDARNAWSFASPAILARALGEVADLLLEFASTLGPTHGLQVDMAARGPRPLSMVKAGSAGAAFHEMHLPTGSGLRRLEVPARLP